MYDWCLLWNVYRLFLQLFPQVLTFSHFVPLTTLPYDSTGALARMCCLGRSRLMALSKPLFWFCQKDHRFGGHLQWRQSQVNKPKPWVVRKLRCELQLLLRFFSVGPFFGPACSTRPFSTDSYWFIGTVAWASAQDQLRLLRSSAHVKTSDTSRHLQTLRDGHPPKVWTFSDVQEQFQPGWQQILNMELEKYIEIRYNLYTYCSPQTDSNRLCQLWHGHQTLWKGASCPSWVEPTD